jgi:hypothetical protein
MTNVYFPYLFEKKVLSTAELEALPLTEYKYKAYNDMIGSLESRMLPTLRKFRDLKVVQGKEIDPLKSIDSQTRSLNAPEATPELD